MNAGMCPLQGCARMGWACIPWHELQSDHSWVSVACAGQVVTPASPLQPPRRAAHGTLPLLAWLGAGSSRQFWQDRPLCVFAVVQVMLYDFFNNRESSMW